MNRSWSYLLGLLCILPIVACSAGDSSVATESAETLPSGLVITHVIVGTGASPGATDTVKVHYEGTFEDGSIFDSSHSRGQPASFPLNRVIACWTEALQLMKPGGRAKLICPGDIAYGPRGRPPTIPQNATLYFDVELLEVL